MTTDPLLRSSILAAAQAPRGAAAWGVGAALALLMIATRGHHFASIGVLPSASWAVFLLAGLLWRPWWGFVVLFALSTSLDFGLLNGGHVDPWCVSPSYGALLPAYASLWLAGRLLARRHALDLAGLVRLVLVLAVAALVAYVFSGGGFYFFSGRYPEPTLPGFAARILRYYPQRLGVLAGYVGAGIAVHVLASHLFGRRPAHQVDGA